MVTIAINTALPNMSYGCYFLYRSSLCIVLLINEVWFCLLSFLFVYLLVIRFETVLVNLGNKQT